MRYDAVHVITHNGEIVASRVDASEKPETSGTGTSVRTSG